MLIPATSCLEIFLAHEKRERRTWFRQWAWKRRYLCRNIRKVYIRLFVIPLLVVLKILGAQQVNAACKVERSTQPYRENLGAHLMKPGHLLFIIILATISSASADYWHSSIGTNSSSWSINRQSGNMTFIQSSLVEGKIAPIEFHGVLLNPYSSYYSEVKANDVRLRERTSALEGDYRSEDEMRL